jgi:hypothetical protein
LRRHSRSTRWSPATRRLLRNNGPLISAAEIVETRDALLSVRVGVQAATGRNAARAIRGERSLTYRWCVDIWGRVAAGGSITAPAIVSGQTRPIAFPPAAPKEGSLTPPGRRGPCARCPARIVRQAAQAPRLWLRRISWQPRVACRPLVADLHANDARLLSPRIGVPHALSRWAAEASMRL